MNRRPRLRSTVAAVAVVGAASAAALGCFAFRSSSGGVGPALISKPVPGLLMKLQVRLGMGAMPAFSTADIPPMTWTPWAST
jgi:hypothetical protein